MKTKANTDIDAAANENAATSDSASRPEKKSARLLALLQRADGASIEDISNELGWQQHTSRAALTGLRKKGHEISKAKEGSITIYRVAA